MYCIYTGMLFKGALKGLTLPGFFVQNGLKRQEWKHKTKAVPLKRVVTRDRKRSGHILGIF